MTRTTARMSRRVLVSALSLLFGTAAHAGYYPGHLDPGGNGFDIPGFHGDAVFSITPGCFESEGWNPTTANGVSGSCSASVYSATINLYSTDLGDPPLHGQVLDSFTLGTNATHDLPLPTFDVLGVLVVNGALAGIDTDPMGPVSGSDTYSDALFWLQFVSGQCEFGCTPVPPMKEHISDVTAASTFDSVDPGYIFVNELDNPSFPGIATYGSECRTANGAPIDCVITATVPEPGTLALLFSALGGGWLARRRKRDA